MLISSTVQLLVLHYITSFQLFMIIFQHLS